jgi:hypothetical protein
LRFPGHYNWIQKQINTKDDTVTAIQKLQHKMEVVIPHVEDDQMYAAVEGKILRVFCVAEISRRFFHKWWKPE